MKQESEVSHKHRNVFRLLDVPAFVPADKIRMLYTCRGATSTHVTQSPLAPLAMSLLSAYFVCLCLSNIMLNPLNTPFEYKPFTSISLLFETHGTLCDICIL